MSVSSVYTASAAYTPSIRCCSRARARLHIKHITSHKTGVSWRRHHYHHYYHHICTSRRLAPSSHSTSPSHPLWVVVPRGVSLSGGVGMLHYAGPATGRRGVRQCRRCRACGPRHRHRKSDAKCGARSLSPPHERDERDERDRVVGRNGGYGTR